ncbi:MAG: 4-hydroxy-3-methylbut-2-enyl diphosphate reductase [Pseudomonadota bacterium]
MKPLTIRLATPRGFCAGVERAIEIVELALEKYGAPVYVRHEIVHNAHVVRRLEAMGAIFVEELKDAPDDKPIIVSAHGAPKVVYTEADERAMTLIDASCPLVLKVHNEARRHVAAGHHVVLVGHRGHPEVVGVVGQAPEGSVTVLETVAEVEAFEPPKSDNTGLTVPLAYVTQTTLSVDEAAGIIDALKVRFPDILSPKKADICFATSNRQAAVKVIAPSCDHFLVVGDPKSSNSKRLVETALAAGAANALLVPDPDAFDLGELSDKEIVGVSSGASAPEELVEDLIAKIGGKRSLKIEKVSAVEENVTFRAPPLPEHNPS